MEREPDGPYFVARRAMIGTDAFAIDAMVRVLPAAYQTLVSRATKRLS